VGLLDRIKNLFTGGEETAGKKDDNRGRDGRKSEDGRRDGKGDSEGGERRGRSRGRRRRPSGERREAGDKPQRTEHDKSASSEPKSPGQARRGSRGRGRGKGPGTGTKTASGPESGARIETGTEPAERSSSRRGSEGGDQQSGRSRSRGKRPGRSRHGKSSELGGTTQRIEFPELLAVTPESEEFGHNEFRPLGLSDRLVLTLAANRFRTPTDIQREMIPQAIQGRDILGQAKTGTGKTIAFLMPIFERIDTALPQVQALIVVPTR